MASNTSAVSYKYQFVSEPDVELMCPICFEVAEEPWQHGECGRLFCEKCLNKPLGRNKLCPNCRGGHSILRISEVRIHLRQGICVVL